MSDSIPPAIAMFDELLANADGKKKFFDAVAAAFKAMHGGSGASYNVDSMGHLAAAIESYNYASVRMAGKPRFPHRNHLLRFAVDKMTPGGSVLEFGVWAGDTINQLATLLPSSTIYGFDSFEGLPESWIGQGGKGQFSREGKPPQVRANVELVVGWFDRTLPSFLSSHDIGNISLLHIDCDLYSSTQTIFANLREKIVTGTIIVFDEYFNYPTWKRHEFRAFQEFVDFRQLKYEYIGLVPVREQVAVRILG